MTGRGFMGLEVDGLAKRYDARLAVADVSLRIPQGEFWCFLGPSGCGKTTLLRMVAGLDAPSSGRLRLNDRDITQVPASGRNFGMVFQSLALFPHLDVAENIGYVLKLRGKDARQRGERVRELLELVRLPDIGRRRIDQLSGGQRQRVAIARALAQEPRLFLMDEPLSALDAKMRDHMQVELKQLQRALKITTIFVTHDQREAMAIADKIVVMNDGRVQQVGSPVDIYRRPANRFVAGFIGQSNLFDVEVTGPRAVRLGGTILPVGTAPDPLCVGERLTLCVRPEDVRLRRPDGEGPVGQVVFVRDFGSSLEARLSCAGREIIVSTTAAQWADCVSDDRIGLRFPSESLSLLSH